MFPGIALNVGHLGLWDCNGRVAAVDLRSFVRLICPLYREKFNGIVNIFDIQ